MELAYRFVRFIPSLLCGHLVSVFGFSLRALKQIKNR